LVRKVRIARADGKPPTAKDAALNAVAQAMAGAGWIEQAKAGEPADFVATLSDDGSEFRVGDRAGKPITNLRPALKADPAEAPKLVARLVHLAKFRATEELANNDENSPLAGKLVAELVGYQDGYDTSEKPDPKPFPKGGVPTLKDGQWTFLRIKNNSSQVLN